MTNKQKTQEKHCHNFPIFHFTFFSFLFLLHILRDPHYIIRVFSFRVWIGVFPVQVFFCSYVFLSFSPEKLCVFSFTNDLKMLPFNLIFLRTINNHKLITLRKILIISFRFLWLVSLKYTIFFGKWNKTHKYIKKLNFYCFRLFGDLFLIIFCMLFCLTLFLYVLYIYVMFFSYQQLGHNRTKKYIIFIPQYFNPLSA